MDKTPVRLSSLKDIAEKRKAIRSEFGSVVSNYTVFPATAQKWLDAGELFCLDEGRAFFLLHPGSRVNDVYFFADSYTSVEDSAKEISINNGLPMVLEIVGKYEEKPLHAEPLMILQRMSSQAIPEVTALPDGVESAGESDIPDIEAILLKNFNPTAERIPDRRELLQLISNPLEGGIFVVREVGSIVGLMAYSKDKSTIHLRYWLTDPARRGQKIGSRLLNAFFMQGRVCGRMILWVDITNRNAIEKYEHYGFSKELMFDYIYEI